jgi:4'-phosphopantetheinyl transferase
MMLAEAPARRAMLERRAHMLHKDAIAASPPAMQLWHAYPEDLLDENVARACATILSGAERGRAARFHFDRHRREYLATHALLRTALAHNHPLEPAAWRFVSNPHGKPAPEPDCGLRFNLSNAKDLAVCLVDHGAEVGVDVEPLARAAEIAKLAAHVFSPAEQAQLAGLSDAERLDRGLSLWVLKEAYVKARGLGLAVPLKGFSLLFGGPERIRLVIESGSHSALHDSPDRWRFCLLDHAAHRIALMVEAAPRASSNPCPDAQATPDSCFAAALEVWEARPPLGPARMLANYIPEWLPRP